MGPLRTFQSKAITLGVALAVSGGAALYSYGAAGAAPAPAPAQVSTPAAGALAAISHPQDDYAGSTIRAREGTSTVSSTGSRTLTALSPTGAVVAALVAVAQTPGLDVSRWQGNVNWASAKAKGAKFAYIKATESTTYVNPYFAQQYNGANSAGLIRGAYHFALPDRSGGVAQANYLVAHGGKWSKDGKTLPPALDMEYNPYNTAAPCYGLSKASMVSWVRAFSGRVHALTGRYPTIYTSTAWWTLCTGNSTAFGSTNPLWIPRYGSSVGTLPAGWGFHTIWQYSDSGTFPGDQDRFNGTTARLKALATG